MNNGTACLPYEESGSVTIPVPMNYIIVIVLLMLSALFSGLTLGLLSLDKMGLQIVIGGDNPIQAKYARAILPIRQNGNLLLCTLLLGNVSVNSLLSILMADMTSGVVGFLSSTILIVICGEIIPQAACSRYALFVGYHTLYIVRFFIVVFYFMAFPLGWCLDQALGEDLGTIMSKAELRTMLNLHIQHGAVDEESGKAMDGALRFREMAVADVMTPAESVFMISLSDTLNLKVMTDVFKAGYSRIPVYEKDRNDIVCVILTKDMLFVDTKDEIPIRNFVTLFGRRPPVVWPDQKLGEVLKMFRQSHGHMAIVRDVCNSGPGDPYYVFKGLVTLEDIIEEILGQEIEDEYDDGDDGVTSVRDRDLARLKLLHGSIGDDKLALEELQAVSTHLYCNVPQFAPILHDYHSKDKMTIDELQAILAHVTVTNVDRTSTDDMLSQHHPASEDVLFARGVPTNKCILVLSGKIAVFAGKDEFKSEMGPWSLVGVDALTCSVDTFIPDFSANILSEHIRYVTFTKSSFQPSSVPKHMTAAARFRGNNLAAKKLKTVMGSNAALDSMARKNTAATETLENGSVFTKRGETYHKIPDQEVTASPMWPKDDHLEHRPAAVEMTTKAHHVAASSNGTGHIGDFV